MLVITPALPFWCSEEVSQQPLAVLDRDLRVLIGQLEVIRQQPDPRINQTPQAANVLLDW
jgi:hypothetical protein